MPDNTIEFTSDLIRQDFDEKFNTISKNDQIRPFSIDIILRDLVDGGITVLDALDVIYEIRHHLYQNITTMKILQLINQALIHLDLENKFIAGNYLEPLLIELPDKSTKVFNYRLIKQLIKDELSGFQYTSNTFGLFVEELHRVVISLRSRIIKLETIQKMIPSVLRNIIGLNPLSSRKLEEDYTNMRKSYDTLNQAWKALPHDDKKKLLISLYESLYRIFLVLFDYLPGHNLSSTITQVNQLIAELTRYEHVELSDKQVYLLGKSSRKITELLNPKTDSDLTEKEMWMEAVEELRDMVDKLHHKAQILWLIVIDQSGSELYAKYTNATQEKHRSLLGMAITGIQTIVSELTEKSIRQIEQDEGIIYIETRTDFSVITLMDIQSPYLSLKISELADFIDEHLLKEIRNFKGQVDIFYEYLDEYLEKQMGSVFI